MQDHELVLFQRDLKLRLGLAYQSTGQFDEAIASFREAAFEDPDSYFPPFQLGVCFLKQGEWESAFRNFTQAIHLGPAAPESYNNLGLTYWMQTSEEGPEECFVKAISLQEGLPEAVGNLGVHYLMGGRFPEAVRCFEVSVLANQNSSIFSNLGVAFALQGALEEARRCFEKAIALDGNFAAGYENLSAFYEAGGFSDEARRAHAKSSQHSLGLVLPFKRFFLSPLLIEQALPLKG